MTAEAAAEILGISVMTFYRRCRDMQVEKRCKLEIKGRHFDF